MPNEPRDPDMGMRPFYNPNNRMLKQTPMLQEDRDLSAESVNPKQVDMSCYPSNQSGYLGHFKGASVMEQGHNTDKVHKVMHEYKHGKLRSGSKHGPKVRSRKQAIAIALSEARKHGEDV